MTVQAHPRRGWTTSRAPLLGGLLVLVLLIPVGLLFGAHWRDLGDRASATTHERQGIEYLTALSQLTVALADVQSAAVGGQVISRDALTRAVEATAGVDRRLGGTLRVSERWSQLRDTVEQLSATEYDDPYAAYTAYSEATGLLLDLHDKLRETSGLIRAVDPDTYYLQDGAGEELPEGIVAAGRLVDLVSIAAAGESAVTAAEISVGRVGVTGPTEDLANDLQAALDSTASRTLSSNVLSKLDQFLREKDSLLAVVPPDGNVSVVDPEALARLRVDLQAAATDLVNALLLEMDGLVESRLDGLDRRRWLAVGGLVAAVLLALGVAWLNLAAARRGGWLSRDRGPAGPARVPTSAPEPVDVVQAELVEWEQTGAR
jgi:hypothetical protein